MWQAYAESMLLLPREVASLGRRLMAGSADELDEPIIARGDTGGWSADADDDDADEDDESLVL
jgi:hypothetical protein